MTPSLREVVRALLRAGFAPERIAAMTPAQLDALTSDAPMPSAPTSFAAWARTKIERRSRR